MARTLSACCVGGIAALGVAGAVSAGEIDPALGDILRTAAGDEVISTIVYLANQADLELARRDLRLEFGDPLPQRRILFFQLFESDFLVHAPGCNALRAKAQPLHLVVCRPVNGYYSWRIRLLQGTPLLHVVTIHNF